jgi:hypothetical protein
MADKKISQLPLATTPLSGSEVLPIVQGGDTEQVSVANLTAGRDVSVKKLTATDNVVVGTAGKGIDFSANTHAAGMTSELLTWYEEGVWTGTLIGDVAAPTTPVTVDGRYTRIGRQVTLQISLFNVDTTGASGVMLITGLPFTNSAERAYGSCFFISMGSAVATAHIQASDSRISFLDAVTGSYINISAGGGKYIGLSITYTV